MEYQSCDLDNIVVQKQRLAMFCVLLQHSRAFFLHTDIFVSNFFWHPEIIAYLCVPFAVLLPFDPSPNTSFLQHSMLSCSESTLQISKCHSQSVSPILARQVSLDKYESTRLTHWLDHWQNDLLIQQNTTVLIKQIHTLLRRSRSESNSIFRLPSYVGLIRRHKIIHV